ncbi:hypothetical protein GCM10007888_37620 [Methylobacterium oxalidis]|uniref:PepSY domain-containing protein n=1 Tax=Methylobacterium oxalidis TaxID=944322 RepID=A0ABQ6DMP8_9HYPH|nr:hypothetical protein LDDCCGHA_6124 [Methylobacterium oxalidis]GLS65380.1 hypothetical protein GCM10007888_37620 [Methylobacterium oxalidis]
MKILASISSEEVLGGYQLTVETDDGQVTRLFATENYGLLALEPVESGGEGQNADEA